LREIREVNPNVYFLLENVRMKIEHERVITNFLKVRPCRFNSDLVSAQNRERLYWTNIPVNSLPPDRRLVLKDILEKEVDKKYFLSEKALSFFLQNSMKMEEAGNGFRFEPTDGNTKGKAVTTRNGSRMDDNFIKVDTLIDFSHRNEGIRYYEDKSPTLNARDYKQPRCVKTTTSIRKLTPVECERLQTVPDNYTIIVSDTQRYKMLGNGWTVDIIAHILKHMK
jgi:site-specific DNA-cytosine methylase